jgi:hypothetical protein
MKKIKRPKVLRVIEPNKEEIAQVQSALDYLIAEGIAIKIGDGYRLKTKKELQEEMSEILS